MRTALLALIAVAFLVLAGGTAIATTARTAGAQAAADMHDQMAAQPAAEQMMAGTGMAEMHAAGGMDAVAGADMDAMHDRMHAQMSESMPSELLERCDDLHAEMSEHMSDGSAGAGRAADHAAHHPDR
jgi:hypothetical protein